MPLHQPVLLHEVLTSLDPRPGETLLDATLNRAGHARALAERLGPGGTLIGLDLDAQAVAAARANLADLSLTKHLLVGNYRELDKHLAQLGIKHLDVALFDLGLSSEQLEQAGRGFSFLRDEPLLMTFAAAPAAGTLTAYEIVNGWREASLAQILTDYGEERFATRIAAAIAAARAQAPIRSSGELEAVIRAALPAWARHGRLHPATRSFQALRMATNDELGAITEGLTKAWNALAPGGRLGVISFHSLEARLVKNQFKVWRESETGELLTKHALKPEWREVQSNPRARSAQLRVIKKL